ncbi:hypothetical protein ACFX2J_025561 [Malus domestica]
MSHQSKIITYLQGPEQDYLISCNLPVISFVLVLAYEDKDKESNMSELPLKLPVRNRLPGTFPDCLPSVALEGQILQEKMPHMHGGKARKILLKQGEQVRKVKMIH